MKDLETLYKELSSFQSDIYRKENIIQTIILLESGHSTLIISLSFNIIGRDDNVWGETGVTILQSTSYETIGPPADNE